MADTVMPDVGQLAPDFRLRGPGGVHVTLSEYRGDRNVVLVFYPLAFSPVCSLQLPSIERDLPRIEALGASVLGISVDSHHANQAFAERLGLSFPLLSDFHRRTAAAYGVLLAEAGISHRAVFVVDRDGRIAYRDVAPDPGQVPSNDRLIAALEALR
jgi:peroxiredoxin (alkyl hydroperoxide reductase subunit C)